MIIISEKPTIIGKLIHLNPQFYQSPGRSLKHSTRSSLLSPRATASYISPRTALSEPWPFYTPLAMVPTTS